jgi:hypothetical protein
MMVLFFLSVVLISNVSVIDAEISRQISDGSNAAQSIVVNGDFEIPKVTDYYHYTCYSANQIKGWTMEWVSQDKDGSACVELQRNEEGVPPLKEWAVGYWKAAKGYQWAELDSDTPVRIYQDLPTIPGRVYNLSFAFSPRPAEADNRLEVKWGNSTIDVLSADGSNKTNTDWRYYTYNVTAVAGATRLEFADLSNPDGLGTFIDDVKVTLSSQAPTTILATTFESQASRIITGTWDVNQGGSYAPAGGYIGKMTINGNDSIIQFEIYSMSPEALTEISFDGKNIKFRRPGSSQWWTGEISGDTITGTMTQDSLPGETFPWNATRVNDGISTVHETELSPTREADAMIEHEPSEQACDEIQSAILSGNNNVSDDISGKWNGTLLQGSTVFPYSLDIYGLDTSISGTSRIGEGEYYAIMDLSGSISNNILSLRETNFVEHHHGSGWRYILKNVNLNINQDNPYQLNGTWNCAEPDCNPQGTLLLTREPAKDSVGSVEFVGPAQRSGGNRHFYEAVLASEGISWNDANNAANKMGGHLATISSEDENQFIYNLISSDDRFWIFDPEFVVGPWLGGFQDSNLIDPNKSNLEDYRKGAETGWRWVTGEPFAFTKWANAYGQPDNIGIPERKGNFEDKLNFIGKNRKEPYWNDLASTCQDYSGPCSNKTNGYIVEFDGPNIEGTWAWFSGQTVVIHKDGTLDAWTKSTQDDTGKWILINATRQLYVIQWNLYPNQIEGYVDLLLLSPDSNKLEGYSLLGTKVTGNRIA